MTNPLLSLKTQPQFSEIKPEHIEPALQEILQQNRETLKSLLQQDEVTWENLIQPFEDMDVYLSKMWSIVSHLNNVVNTKELRDVYNRCLPLLTEYGTEIAQNAELYHAFESIKASPQFQLFSKAQQRVINNGIRDFKLSGVALPEAEKKQYKEIQKKLAALSTKFEENVLDATDGWTKLITDKSLTAGVPEHALKTAENTANKKELKGWLFTLEFPSYYAIITFADNRELRKEFYTAYATRASDQGPQKGKWDNTKVMADILKLRFEEAQLINFNNYAKYSLATKMAKDPQQVMRFLNELAFRSKHKAEEEWQELMTFANVQLRLDDVAAWDVAYVSEKLRQHKHQVSQEQFRPYFPVDHVLTGLFSVAEKLYGIQIIEKVYDVDTWHDDVRYFEINDDNGNLRASFYVDLYARPQKRGGAWMDSCMDRHCDQKQNLQLPMAFLCCNFTPPIDSLPALLTHEEVVTIFHEFGHGLHHMLTKINIASVAGINGVEWDAVEFPSQFMENWCWQKETMPLISCHYQTKEPLPDDLLEKLLASKTFQAGMQMVRQLEFSLFDFRIHLDYAPEKGDQIQEILDEVRKQVAVVAIPAFNRFQHGFSHIFGGGYAAGYYSYKWAEVLASDAFTQFEDKGIFDKETGKYFLNTILEQGGSVAPMELFVEFQGREPKIDALLKHCGIY